MKHKDQLEKKTSKPDQVVSETGKKPNRFVSGDMNKASLMAYLLS